MLRLSSGLNIFRFLLYLREELTIVLATASSDAVLPQIMRKLERLGVRQSVVGLVIPTGYSLMSTPSRWRARWAICWATAWPPW